MSALTTQSASDLQSYVQSHALPENGGYLVLEQAIDGRIPFRFEVFPLVIEGVIDLSDLSISGDLKVYIPLKGYTTVYHFYGSLTEGVSFSLDLFVIKGSIALKLEPFQGRKWFTAVIDVVPIVGGEIHETFHIFPIPFTSAGAGVEVNGFVAGSTVSAADLNKQWLEQLHLFSKLALANGGALPVPSEVSVTA